MNMDCNFNIARKRGFTLIEALVALFIVSIALFAMTSKVSLSAKIAGKTERSTYGRWIAMNAITELRLKPGLPKEGRSDGDEEMAGRDWRWDMEISNTPVEGLRRVDVSVSLADRPDYIVYEMSAFVGTNNPDVQLRPWEGVPDGNNNPQPGNSNSPVAPPGAPVTPVPRPRDTGLEPIG